MVPSKLPSIFPKKDEQKSNVDFKNSRNSEARGVLSGQRSSRVDQLNDFEKQDKLSNDFDLFKQLLPNKNLPVDFIIKENHVFILSFTEDLQIEFLLKISRDFSVIAKRFNEKVSIPVNLLGFQRKLNRCSAGPSLKTLFLFSEIMKQNLLYNSMLSKIRVRTTSIQKIQ